MSDQLIVEREGLEKKDKSELQTIVSALGGSASSRARKSDLIDQILELSGATSRGGASTDEAAGGEAGSAADESSDAPSGAGEAPDAGETDDGEDGDDGNDEGRAEARSGEPEEPATEGTTDGKAEAKADGKAEGKADGKAEGKTDGKAKGGDHPVGPDGEPLADWEVQILEEGGDAPSRGGRNRGGQRGDRSGQRREGNGRGSGDGSGSGSGKGSDAKRGRNQSGERGGGRDSTKTDTRSDAKSDDKSDKSAKKDAGNGNGNGEGNDDVDPNNRRSRRRNRNRNRDRDDAGNDAVSNDPVEVEGYLDLRDEGYAFVRVNGFLPSRDDAYVSVKQVRTHGLRKGDHVSGLSRPASRNEKNPALQQINTVNGRAPDEMRGRPRFDRLTPLFPDERLKLERPDEPLEMTTRIIDLMAPIGKGQRGLIVSPPKAGKTSIMKQIARSIEVNNPEVELIVLLVDERPEEVTDMERHLERGEVVSSTFDRPPEEHTAVAELTLERAKRLVEDGKDVCLIIDGITRLARAYNMSAPQSGRVLSGGVDAAALYPPKRFLGAARNVEEGGSLTMLATALVETGSRMDEVIFEEFKGTGNMELRLDRRLAEKRIFPAIDVEGSSTRNEELLRDRKQVEASWKLRKVIAGMNDDAGGSSGGGIEMLVERLKTFKTNADFLAEVAKSTV